MSPSSRRCRRGVECWSRGPLASLAGAEEDQHQSRGCSVTRRVGARAKGAPSSVVGEGVAVVVEEGVAAGRLLEAAEVEDAPDIGGGDPVTLRHRGSVTTGRLQEARKQRIRRRCEADVEVMTPDRARASRNVAKRRRARMEKRKRQRIRIRRSGPAGPRLEKLNDGSSNGTRVRVWVEGLDTIMQKTIERYRTYAKDNISSKTVQQDIEQVKADAEGLAKKLEALEGYKRKLLGEKLEECSIEELHSLEIKLEKSLHSIRGRKTQLLEEQVTALRQKELTLLQDNEDLRGKCKNQLTLVTSAPMTVAAQDENPDQNNDHMDVETELIIGLPGRHRSDKATTDNQANRA